MAYQNSLVSWCLKYDSWRFKRMQTSHLKCHLTVKISLMDCYLRCTPCACLTFQEIQGEKQNTLFLNGTCDLLWGDYPMLLLLFQGRIVFQVSPDGLPYHGVLAHENFSSTTQRLTDLLHLFGPYIVHTNQKHLRKFIHILLLRKVHLQLLSKLLKSFPQ